MSPPSTSRIRLILIAAWALLSAAALAFIVVLGSNCPNADEWGFVGPITGHEPLAPWLWDQHNEHRLPLPRLVYYALFQFTHDFRAGSILQVVLLSATSLWLMRVAARFRGQPYWTDLFFPLSLLHVGHWENLLIGYNLCFAMILVLETAIGVVALGSASRLNTNTPASRLNTNTPASRLNTTPPASRPLFTVGILMVLLCLCGGGGVIAAIPVAVWLAYLAIGGRKPLDSQAPTKTLPADEAIINAIDRRAAPEEKVRQLQKLTEENSPLVDEFLRELDARFGTRSKSNWKTPQSLLAKASRPSIRRRKPWHDVEHIRDSFRFKTVLKDIRDLPAIVRELETKLGAAIIKRDTEKFLRPGHWGWRIVAFDLRMPNGQLVEYYLPVEELEHAKDEGGNHVLFEKWRNRDEEQLEAQDYREMQKDIRESRRVYQAAFEDFLSRSGATETELRAILSQVAASSSEAAKKSSLSSSKEKAIPDDQDFPSLRVDAANPSESRTIIRPSGALEATAIISPLSSTIIADAAAGAKGSRWGRALLLAFAAFPFVYLAAYLDGYQRPGHHPNLGEGGLDVVRVAAQVIAMSFGHGVARYWVWVFGGIGFLALLTATAASRDARQASQRPALFGWLAIALGIGGVALAIGLGRAGLDARSVLASRYAYLTWPLLALAYLFWAQRGGWGGKWIPLGLCLAAAIAYPMNMTDGLTQGSRIHSGLDAVQDDARHGTPPERIVRRFPNTFQAHQEERAIRAMPMLREAGIGAFAR